MIINKITLVQIANANLGGTNKSVNVKCVAIPQKKVYCWVLQCVVCQRVHTNAQVQFRRGQKSR